MSVSTNHPIVMHRETTIFGRYTIYEQSVVVAVAAVVVLVVNYHAGRNS